MTYATPDWTDPLTWGIALGLLALLVVQGWHIVRSRTLSPGRRALRAGLNGLLWLAVLGYVLRLSWPVNRPVTHALLVGDDVPPAHAQTVQERLRIRERFTAPTFKAVYDSVTLVGQDFPTETLTRLSQSVVHWVPYDAPDQLQEVRWKGVVRQGELQRVTGRIQSVSSQLLRIQYGNQTLDSLKLTPGRHAFALQFPVFGRGRLQTELRLGDQLLDTVRFYSRPTAPLLVQFVLDNPDFESKTLADWLGKQGHSVALLTTLASNVRSRTGINRRHGAAKRPNLVITDPANAANAIVRNALATGKAVLFINLSRPAADVITINRALSTRWQVKKFSNQETVPAANGLTAHPYRFIDRLNQFAVPGYPVAVQQTAGRVGVSLLNETFPLTLRGDSVAYGRIWHAMMARLQPTDSDNILVDAPIFSGLPAVISVNNAGTGRAALRVGSDTIRLGQSPLNRQSAVGILRTKQAGWQPVQDSLAVYVAHLATANPVAARQLVSRYMLAHSRFQSNRTGTAGETGDASPGETVSPWVWLTLFLVCLTALWIEPKIA